MSRLLVILGGIAGLVVLVALIVPLVAGVDRYKPRLEAAASDALGMDVKIRGRLSIGLLPGFRVTIGDAHILDRQGASVASATRVTGWIRILPLLRGELRFSRLDLARPSLDAGRDAKGWLNLDGLRKAAPFMAVLDGARVSLSDGTMRYTDQRSGGGFAATDVDLDVRNLRLAGGSGPRRLSGTFVHGRLACGEFRTKDFAMTAIQVPIDGRDGVLRLDPVTLKVFGGQTTGSLQVEVSSPVPAYQVRCSLEGLRIEEFLRILSPDETARGAMDFSADLSMRGRSVSHLVQSATGDLRLRGGNLTLVGNDLDQAISRFESSQNFNLVDVAGVFLVGPLGLAATKGYNFASLFRGTGGPSRIDTLVSDWRVDRGVARATDVALATPENRIALQGGLDLVNRRFAGVTVAVVDKKGCASVRQEIHGAFGQPTVEKPRFLTSLVGPALRLLRQTRRVLPSGPCETFYSGSVPPPK